MLAAASSNQNHTSIPMAIPLTFSKPKRPFNDPVSPAPKHPAFIRPPITNNVNLSVPIDVIVPGAASKIALAKTMVFHCLGDSGGIHGTETQESLADVMVQQIEDSRANHKPAQEPLFFYHLGDVVYFNGISRDYPVQFYEPYQKYDAPIMAIPGNHDGDTRTRSGDEPDDETTLFGFIQNFCAPSPHFIFKHRPTMTQPYVYWTLDTPLATIVGLYSNVDGQLDGQGTFEQQRWFTQQLKDAPKDRALIVAVHHAPYSLDSTHGGYADIGDAIDRAATTAGRMPDLVLSGHVHNYQRFTRKVKNKKVTYVVAGAGGYADTLRSMHRVAKDPATGRTIKPPFVTARPGVKFEACNDTEPGFLRLTVTKKQIVGEYFTVDFAGAAKGVRDKFTVTV